MCLTPSFLRQVHGHSSSASRNYHHRLRKLCHRVSSCNRMAPVTVWVSVLAILGIGMHLLRHTLGTRFLLGNIAGCRCMGCSMRLGCKGSMATEASERVVAASEAAS